MFMSMITFFNANNTPVVNPPANPPADGRNIFPGDMGNSYNSSGTSSSFITDLKIEESLQMV